MKKLLSLLVIMLTFTIGLFGCSAGSEENFWVDSQLQVLNLLNVDSYTPVANGQKIKHFLKWDYIDGATYRVRYRVNAVDTILYSSNSSYTIVVGGEVTMAIPDIHIGTTFTVSYSIGDDSTQHTISNVYRYSVWNKVPEATYYEVSINSITYNSVTDKYNKTENKIYNTYETTDSTIIFRTAFNGAHTDHIHYSVVEYDRTVKNKGFTILRSNLDGIKYIYDETDQSSKTLIDLIQYSIGTNTNIYRTLETKYLALIRSAFINITEYAKLLQYEPPTLTSKNKGELKNAFASLNKETKKAVDALNSIYSSFLDYKENFKGKTAASYLSNDPTFLTNLYTPEGGRLLDLQIKITPEIGKLIDYSDYFQEFCEKYYNITPSAVDIMKNAKIHATNEYNVFDNSKYTAYLTEQISNGVITPLTVKYYVISHQQKLLKPVYNYYFTEYNGKYNMDSEQELFNQLNDINTYLMRLNTEVFSTSDVTHIFTTLSNFEKIDDYFDIERELFLQGLEKVDISKVTKVDTSQESGYYVWEKAESNMSFFFLVKVRVPARDVTYSIAIHDIPFIFENNKNRILTTYIRDYLTPRYGVYNTDYIIVSTNLYKIENDAFVKRYNDKIISFANDIMAVQNKYLTPVRNLLSATVSINLYYDALVLYYDPLALKTTV